MAYKPGNITTFMKWCEEQRSLLAQVRVLLIIQENRKYFFFSYTYKRDMRIKCKMRKVNIFFIYSLKK